MSKINDRDVERLDKDGKLANYAATHDIGKLGIERYYEDTLHGKTGYEEVEVNNRGRVIRQLHEQPPSAGQDVYLTLDPQPAALYRAAAGRQPRRGGGERSAHRRHSGDGVQPELRSEPVRGRHFQQGLSGAAERSESPTDQPRHAGVYPPASTVKPYIAVSALSAGVITKNTVVFDPGWWQLPGSEKRFRDWKKWGHGRLNVTKALEESADTYFYQVAYDMGIDRLSTWLTKFGYGQYTGIDLSEERSGLMPTREWKLKRYKKPWYQGDTIPVGIGQGYWTATPIQMAKALNTLINDGTVKTPHLLQSTRVNGALVPFKQEENAQIGDIHSGFWEIAKDGMYGVANRPNGTARKYFADAPLQSRGEIGYRTGIRLRNLQRP